MQCRGNSEHELACASVRSVRSAGRVRAVLDNVLPDQAQTKVTHDMSDGGGQADAKLTTFSICPLSVLAVPYPVTAASAGAAGAVAVLAVAPILLSSGPDLMSCRLRRSQSDADDVARAEDDEPQARRRQQQQQQRRRRRRRQRRQALPRLQTVPSESLQHTEPNRCSFWQRYSNILFRPPPISSSSSRTRRPQDAARVTRRRQQPSCATAVDRRCSRGRQQQPTVALTSSSSSSSSTSSNHNTREKRPTHFCCTVAA
ncbi:uncharacterized protein LOC126574653 [Anopheles aquasalis]|uniref:uncharacterized protein LOC126574653 n=1 Tax=Anopheles aquasalis TaxID=42839 RepID=UPI00215B1A4E|nr:uncharacterized protein LOC126574653 [Anopheles aquasalis]